MHEMGESETSVERGKKLAERGRGRENPRTWRGRVSCTRFRVVTDTHVAAKPTGFWHVRMIYAFKYFFFVFSEEAITKGKRSGSEGSSVASPVSIHGMPAIRGLMCIITIKSPTNRIRWPPKYGR
jgi:hypothetical protein